jgi:hypothetical protein
MPVLNIRSRRLDMRRPNRATALLLAVTLLLGASARAQLGFKAPESVRLGLSVLSQVVANTGRLIAAGRYEELPSQAREVEAGIDSLQRGLGDQPQAFETKLVPIIAELRVASGAMSEAATHDRTAMLPVVHDQLAQAVSALIELFPRNLRPAAHAGGASAE